MAKREIFSKRQKRLRGELPEIYTYDVIPKELRIQIHHLLNEVIGENDRRNNNVDGFYETIYKQLCKEYGRFYLASGSANCQPQVLNFILETNTEEVLDVVESAFELLNYLEQNFWDYYFGKSISAVEATQELNDRFKEHGIGYAFEGNQIIRIDSTYIHTEVTKPTISLLYNEKFKGANEEYMKAHEHYKNKLNKECLNDCLKAFESTMKVICTEKGWNFNQTDTAKQLVELCFKNNLIPQYTQNQFSGLQNILISGIPTLRNKLGSHGQGQVPQKVDDAMVRYALNLTGSNIILLIEYSGLKDFH